MAELKLYRAIFVVGEEEDRIQFSEWCVIADKDHILSEIAENFGGIASPNYEVLGWEEKELDTDPF